jgi:hypothetical protein
LTFAQENSSTLPLELTKSAYVLDDSGYLAWRYADAKAVVAFLKATRRIILGGEVFTLSRERIDLTWEFWEYETDETLTDDMNIERSQEEALKYLNSHRKKFGDAYCYSIVFGQN